MFGKKKSAASNFVMAMGKKAGNLKEPPGGSSKHSHDKKSKMAMPVKSGPVPPVGKKAPMAVQGEQHPVKPRQRAGKLGMLKVG